MGLDYIALAQRIKFSVFTKKKCRGAYFPDLYCSFKKGSDFIFVEWENPNSPQMVRQAVYTYLLIMQNDA